MLASGDPGFQSSDMGVEFWDKWRLTTATRGTLGLSGRALDDAVFELQDKLGGL